ncbi:unnamed protein product [Mytilus edulis]|uniref:Myb/SANT-like DNA-binding domain-containing protein n=1 Tax=Mytilus edulis TaxID=6550 RepID=A0A8S3V0G9_MYTED|nr:unnamed protein product [Mytilus edulis]
MAEEQPPKKIPRIRGQNFSSIEVNLISRRVVEELGLLRGKFGKDVTADAKNKMWEKITAEVNALGVSYRQVLTVKTKFRNLTRDAKDKFTYEKKERNRTGGGPAPKPISVAEENIINALKDTSSFKGIDDGMETSVGKYFWFTDVNNVLPFISNNKSDGFPQQTETSESTPTQFSIQGMYLKKIFMHTHYLHENKRTKKPKKTAEDVYELQCLVLESNLKRNQTQMELFKKQMELYDMMKKNLENSCTESMLEALLH